jgi:polyprenyl-phospho-N-acetylgalactosaminyl synthase
MKIFCVIPALNEEKTIAIVLDSVKKFVNNIVVVDDGSSDNTAKIARENNAHVIVHIINRGQGAALQTGNEYALSQGADIIVHFDADGQFLASEIDNIIEPLLSNKTDIVFGSRFLEIKSKIPFFKEKILMPAARTFNRFFLNVCLSDPQCGFRAMTAKAAKLITINNDGMAHCSEIIFKAFKFNLKIREAPVTVIYHRYGQGMAGGINIIKDIFLKSLLK